MAIGLSNPPVALIAGPTASGKSALALALAERTGGVIINADSAQLYRDLAIVSAAPSPSDLKRADHRLFGLLDGASPCSAAEWAAMARAEIAKAHARSRLPILVGGTGLYLRTLIDGIAPVPPIEPEVRRRIRSADAADNRALLEHADPEAAARLNAADAARTARALEVVLSTGRPLTHWQKERVGGIAGDISLRPLILLPPRDWLYRRIDRRFPDMIDIGAIEEVRRLLERGLDPGMPIMRAIGVREIASYVQGELTRDQALAAGQQATRRYAKRQYTWFSHQPPTGWPRFTRPLDGAMNEALELLNPSA